MENNIQQQLKMMTDGFDEWFDRRKKRHNALVGVATFAVVVTVGLLTVGNVPATDGLYVSNISHRTETIQALDQILVARL